jgi:hypothetical protein
LRKYLCLDCNHTWKIIFGGGNPDIKPACPTCKSLNVHQEETTYDWNTESNQASNEGDENNRQEDGDWRDGRGALL